LGDKVSITFTQGYTSGGRGGGRGGRRGGGAGAPPAAAPGAAPAAGTPTPPAAADGNTAPITVAAAAAGAASTPLLDAAAAAAKAADVAIVFVGLNKQFDTEGSDRRDMKLPYGEDALIARVVEANPRTIVVIVAGSPVEMGSWLEQTPAVLLSWYGGSEAGNAIARTLFGAVNPSGKLPCTFPKQLADSPAHALGAYPGANGVEEYKEGLLVGYRWFDTKNIEPLFPFGHGLSYTTFNYSNLRVVPGGTNGAVATAEFDVTNSGSRDGAEVAQLYLHQASPSLPRPDKELKGFQKISLRAGETQTVSIPLGARAFAFFKPDQNGWVAEAGDYQVIIGSSSRDLRLKGGFNLGQTISLPVTAGF